MRSILRALLVVIAAANAGAADRQPFQYERLLLPLHQSIAGAHGTWRVQWWVRNDGAAAVDAFPLALECGLPGPGPDRPLFIVGRPALPPNHTLSCLAGDAIPSMPLPPFIPVRGSTGAFLYVEKGDRRLNVSGTLTFESRSARPDPQQLDAVPESAFHRGTASILPLPLAPDTRYALRIYALPENVDTRAITIRFYEMQPQDAVQSEERLVATLTGVLEPQEPSLAQCSPCDVPDVALAPDIFQLFEFPKPEWDNAFPSTIRVEVSPASPNVRWWAMVSATENATQRVRLFHSSL
jgi:hypothetical protein